MSEHEGTSDERQDNSATERRERERPSRVNSRGQQGVQQGVEWAEADPRKLAWAIDALCNRGGCLRLGRTRDGGAYSIGVYLGDVYFTDYVRPEEDLDDYLDDLVIWAQQQPDTAPAGKQKQPSRKRYNPRNDQGR